MRVAIVSNSDSGGAGIAALRLHKGLMAQGVDSKMLCFNATSGVKDVYQFKKPMLLRAIEHMPIPYKQNKYRRLQQSVPFTATFPESLYDITEHPVVREADIINLHWVGGMLDYKAFFKKVRKPIVWTLHDMNPFSGMSHFAGDISQHASFWDIEERVKRAKASAISQCGNLTIVALCDWMRQISEQSAAFAGRRHVVIPNGIDTDIFKPYDQMGVRRLLDIPQDRPVFMFCCQHVGDHRKGFDLLLSALDKVDKRIFFLVVGDNRGMAPVEGRMRFMGTFRDELSMALLYSASDCFVLPSREDNLPNTMVESLCCGTPVISYTNGGMANVIDNNANGLLVPDMTPEALAAAINQMANTVNKYGRELMRAEAAQRFSPKRQAQSYIQLYQSLIG